MSTDGGPSRKRARIDNGDENQNPPASESSVLRDKDVWLSDGNIIVIAANKVAFRVHKSILSLRSEVFADLFSLPNGDAATAEVMDGHPVVHVSDSPDDIRRLFLVLCCGKNYYYNRDVLVPVPFDVLASLIRTAHKYAIQDVLDDALSRLKRFYTHDLGAWQDPEARARFVTAADEDAPVAVALARLTNTPLLLPAAYLVCVRLATQYWVEADGSVVSAPTSSLSVLEQAQLVHAKGFLSQASATRVLHLLAAVPCHAACASPAGCMAAREAALDTLRAQGLGRLCVPCVSDQYALRSIAAEFWGTDGRARFCGGCRGALAVVDETSVRALWKSLPYLFNVDVKEAVWKSGDDSAGAGQ